MDQPTDNQRTGLDRIDLAILIALSLIAVLGICMHTVDRPVMLYVRHHLHHPIWPWITFFGKIEIYLFLAIVVLVYFRLIAGNSRKADMAFLFIWAVAIPGLLTNVIKIIFGRARPNLLVHENIFEFAWFEFGYDHNSFPSGHSTIAGAAAMSLAIFFPRLTPLWVITFGVIGFSRVFVWAHYVSDVIAGLAWGAFAAWIILRIFGFGPGVISLTV